MPAKTCARCRRRCPRGRRVASRRGESQILQTRSQSRALSPAKRTCRLPVAASPSRTSSSWPTTVTSSFAPRTQAQNRIHKHLVVMAPGYEAKVVNVSARKHLDGEPRKIRIEVTPCRVDSSDTARLVLENLGEPRVGYAPAFKLEKKTHSGWRWINRRQAFTLPLFYLEPGERSDPQPIAVYFDKQEPLKLRPGLYRVTKTIDLTPGKPRPLTMDVKARFRVTAQEIQW
jgi:hypothetical protein